MVFSFSFLSVVSFSFSWRVVPRKYMLKIRNEKRSYHIGFEKCVSYFLASSYPQLLSMVRLIEVLFFKMVKILSLKCELHVDPFFELQIDIGFISLFIYMFLSLSMCSLPKHLIIYLCWFNAVRAGELSAAELENLMVIVANPRQFKIPDWFLNRKKDYKDGRYSQVVSNALDMKLRDDLERLKKIRLLFSMLSSMIVLFRHTGFRFVILFH